MKNILTSKNLVLTSFSFVLLGLSSVITWGQLNWNSNKTALGMGGFGLLILAMNIIRLILQAHSEKKQSDVPSGKYSPLEFSFVDGKANALPELVMVVSRLAKGRGHLVSSLKKVIDFTEESSLAIGRKIAQISSLSRVQLNDSNEICEHFKPSSDNSNSLGGVISGALGLLNEASKLVSDVSAVNLGLVDELNTTLSDIAKLNQQAAELEELALGTRLMSFNARLEASRAGEKGRGFVIVSDEIQKLAVGAGALAQRVSKIGMELSEGVNRTNNILLSSNTSLLGRQSYLKDSVDLVTRTSSDIRTRVNETAQRALRGTNEIATAINEIVSHLQFQDITRQELEKALAQNQNQWGTRFSNLDQLKEYLENEIVRLRTYHSEEVIENQATDSGLGHTKTYGEVVLFNVKKEKNAQPAKRLTNETTRLSNSAARIDAQSSATPSKKNGDGGDDNSNSGDADAGDVMLF